MAKVTAFISDDQPMIRIYCDDSDDYADGRRRQYPAVYHRPIEYE